MDGDEAPLIKINNYCNQNGFHLIVDEAHSTGISGENNFSLCSGLGINPFARLHTFGKAMGCHGAIWITSKTARKYLINFCRTFIYTTALPNYSLAVILASFRILQKEDKLRPVLEKRIEIFNDEIKNSNLSEYFIKSNSPIQSLILPGNEKVLNGMEFLIKHGFNVKAIRKPTVKEGMERIRISLHIYNSDHEIKELIKCLTQII